MSRPFPSRSSSPSVPFVRVNGKIRALDKHYGDQVEIEHAHILNEHPGKVRVLAYHDRAIMASFNDALSWLNAHPGQYTGPDALYAARNNEKDKYGIGINVEQEINENIGYFLRAMVSDGHTETYAFTEVDDSLWRDDYSNSKRRRQCR